MSRLLIVGAGPTGTSFLYQLAGALAVHGPGSPFEVVIVDRGPAGPGLAFSTANPLHILNVPAGEMSVDPANRSHFLDWCRDHHEGWQGIFPGLDPDTIRLPPRRLFGLYLADVLRTTCEFARARGVKVSQRNDEVVSILPTSAGFSAVFQSGSKEAFDNVVLAVGHQASDVYHEFMDAVGYFGSAYDLGRLCPGDEPTAILGTRLSAIDAALTLVSMNYAGPIYMISRSGWLPRVAGRTDPYALRYLTRAFIEGVPRGALSFDQFINLFKAEVEHAEGHSLNWESILAPGPSSLKTFRRDIQEVRTGLRRPWEAVLLALYEDAPTIWQALSGEARDRFRSNFYSLWLTHLGTIPLVTAERILALLESGQLSVGGGLTQVSYDRVSSAYQFMLRAGQKSLRSRILINGTGPGYDMTKSPSPLIADLLASGTASPHICGGLRVDPDNLQLVRRDGSVMTGLFGLGDITHGEWLATADVYHNTVQAGKLVDVLLAQRSRKE